MIADLKIHDSSQNSLDQFLEEAQKIILGKPQELKLLLTCILANGHLLIEDVPGVGKTTFVKTLQVLTGLHYNRIQFTNDMLPADILGGAIFNQNTQKFEFKKGPVFCELLMADEINRATPKTQSACLQAMEEREVSLDGNTHSLPNPFIVVATQNPQTSIGTFPLPESQLDRFMMKLKLGFPTREAERRLLTEADRKEILAMESPVLPPTEILELQSKVKSVHVSDPLISYIQDIVDYSRTSGQGLSPRVSLDLVAASKAYAFVNGQDFVKPQDVQDVAVAVINHRINASDSRGNGWDEAEKLLEQVPIK